MDREAPPFGGAHHVDGYEHLKQRYEALARERQLFLGLLAGIAIGALWEVIRR